MAETLRVLLTNDDGIEAPGIIALRDAFLRRPDTEVFTVAPDRERSTCSHGMTLGKPVAVVERQPGMFAVGGLPADCIFLARNTLLEQRPHVVVSGINRGANLGTDVIFSGTAAGARQAALMGVHGIAASLTAGTNFEASAAMTVTVAEAVARMPDASPLVLNLNFPAGVPKRIQMAPLGRRRYPQAARPIKGPAPDVSYYQLGGPDVHDALIPGTDGWLIDRNIASATLLAWDQTDFDAMQPPAVNIEGIAPPESSLPGTSAQS